MLIYQYFLFFIIAMIFLLLSVLRDEPFWNIVGSIFDSILWFTFAISAMPLEIPYQFWNGTAVVNGTNGFVTETTIYFSYVGMAIGMIMLIYGLVMALYYLSSRREI